MTFPNLFIFSPCESTERPAPSREALILAGAPPTERQRARRDKQHLSEPCCPSAPLPAAPRVDKSSLGK